MKEGEGVRCGRGGIIKHKTSLASVLINPGFWKTGPLWTAKFKNCQQKKQEEEGINTQPVLTSAIINSEFCKTTAVWTAKLSN